MKSTIVTSLSVLGTAFLTFGVIKMVTPDTSISAPEPTKQEIQSNTSPAIEASFTASPSPESLQVQTRFEDLSFCDQLDAIAKGGKNVAQFIINSDYSQKYLEAVLDDCGWHSEQAQVAALTIKALTAPEHIYPTNNAPRDDNDRFGSVDQGIWNNCNGIREPGETYSAACEISQKLEQRRQESLRNLPKGGWKGGWEHNREQ